MKTQTFKSEEVDFIYNEVEDILYLHFKKNNYHSSFELNRTIFDLNKEGELIGLEVFKAKDFFKIPQIKKILSNLVKASVEIRITTKSVELNLFLKSKEKQKTSRESINNSANFKPQLLKVPCLMLSYF
jgi:uncharacterized protein YuzE